MLKGQAKKDYQREYMRGYMRNKRAVKTSLRPNVKTPSINGLILDGNKILGVKKDACYIERRTTVNVQPRKEATLYIDADGHTIPDYL